MKKLIVAALLVLAVNETLAWGVKGHDVIAQIAWNNLTPKAKKKITAIFEGKPIVYYSSWLDEVRNDSDTTIYAQTRTWHYANTEEGKTYMEAEKNPAGDVYTALTMIVEKLHDKNLNDSLQFFYTKCLVHLMGDMHCPMHTGLKSDLGGNLFYIKWFGQPTSLHSIWDDALIESLRHWSYTEWAGNIDLYTKAQKQQVCQGTMLDWVNETSVICGELYAFAERDKNYSYAYKYKYYPVVEQQFLRAGYRLAYVINQLWG